MFVFVVCLYLICLLFLLLPLPGFAVMLTAETTTGCVLGAEAAAEAAALPEDVAQAAAGLMLDEVAEGGCLDSGHQVLCLDLAVFGSREV